MLDSVTLLFATDKRTSLTIVEPQPLKGSLSEINKIEGKPYIAHSWAKKRQLMDNGYIVQMNDCPPIRNLCKYGFVFYAAGTSRLTSHNERKERKTTKYSSTKDYFTHSGDRCSISDSGFLSSWLANSGFVKIITGLVVLCPSGYGLYQGPLPYNNGSIEVLSAIEYGNSMGKIVIDGKKFFPVEINAVAKLTAKETVINKGDPLGVFFPVVAKSNIKLNRVENYSYHPLPS